MYQYFSKKGFLRGAQCCQKGAQNIFCLFACLSVCLSKQQNRSGPNFVCHIMCLSWPQGRFMDSKNYKSLLPKLFCFILFYIVLYCFMLFYIVLYCFILFYIVLYCFILFDIVLYCFMLFYIVLYCLILFVA